jgi:hypothetical protein
LMVIVWVSSANRDGSNDTQQVLHTDMFGFYHRYFFALQALYLLDSILYQHNNWKLWSYLLKYVRIFLD